MDDRRFDSFTRGLGARTNRREAVHWLAWSAVGVLGLSRLPRPVAAETTPGGFGVPCELMEGSCQPPFACFEGICDLPRGCVGKGQPCLAEFPCCADEGLSCVGGACAVAPGSLPATGMGFPDDTERVAGLGLAAAAMLVAGKLIRDKERDPEL